MVKAVNIYTGTYGALFDLFVDNKPSYNDGNSITHTYTVASSYNRENPVFPLIVIE